MKNEDRIVELLADSLKNQDIQSEKLSMLSRNQEIQNVKLDNVNSKLDDLVDVVKDLGKAMQTQVNIMERLMSKFDKVDDLEHRIFLLERKMKS